MARSVAEQDGARLPGTRRFAARARAAEEGITLSDTLLAEIERL